MSLTSEVRRLLILDTETSCLDPREGAVLEVGAILYSVKNGTIAQFSAVLPVEDGIINQAEDTNGIHAGLLEETMPDGCDELWGENVKASLYGLLIRADAIVAHNAEFDSEWMDRLYEGFGGGRPWLCTMDDFEFERARDSRSLLHLAAAYDVPIVRTHRALADCQLIAGVFDALDDLPEKIKLAMRPKETYEAIVPYPGTEAKAAGFQWNRPGYEKRWTRKLAIEDAAALPFRTRKIGG